METIFKTIGFTIAETTNNVAAKKLDLLYIKNPDGTPRWIWEKNQKHPLFLKFYATSSYRAQLFAAGIRFLFYLKLQKIVFAGKSFWVTNQTNTLFQLQSNWALFTGTVGPNNKAILYANACFYKIAMTPSAQQLIHNEHAMLQEVCGTIPNLITPECIQISEEIIQLTDVSTLGKRTNECTLAHLNLLSRMSVVNNRTVALEDWDFFTTLKNEFQLLNDTRIPANMIRKINLLLENTNPNEKITLSLSHGDFTQWNLYEADTKIALYDWELASFERTKAFDYFHFMIQNGVMVERKCWSEIYKTIKENCSGAFATTLFNNELEELNRYLKWYLLLNCQYYLKVYASQPKWHAQIDWLLLVWNEALNTFLTNQKSARELLIMDVFDSLQNQEYAGLKVGNYYPEKLPENADIDLIVTQKTSKNLMNYIQNHALVANSTFCKKSFMNSVLVFLTDGSFLALDLITQLKVKNLEIGDAKAILANSFRNNHGVKNASESDTARFIALFYTLNGAKIPAKYLALQTCIQNSTAPLDVVLQKSPKEVLHFIKKTKPNRAMNFIKNTLNYGIDTLKDSSNNRGFSITFSGVDGAGKSTVIENIAVIIEKRLRKKVVVLRHRPSVLPILSVWTKGKQKAHQDAVESLPRQGQNQSLLSSLLRFSYYYLDYLLGQFVVYFKHILRGDVVLYDRYYFDFINDSKRSNIVLPKNISVFGYRFLLKPKFNFFLFADAAIILKRKQELSKITIEKLTQEYQLLFESLQSQTTSTVYTSINNVELELTLQQILTTITQKKS
ncbi:hypothetical protein [Flavobacterium restrictum]|uniref:Thymidylate kinase n=1 Tax=Flavobacterium restrictum TaxID=2594428 RepID=A0A553E3A1_9FLAO|nr:hypothetical protein [Flavobacterium restrictum]TRX39484.1 hypothetical protein FNW21_09335 [Flavobacterium restrictum]